MRKVTFQLGPHSPLREGFFHGFFKCSYNDGERDVEWTAAFIEDHNTGKVHKCDTDSFCFLDKPNQGEGDKVSDTTDSE